MTRVASTLHGYASVARASEVLHLAKRSIRDLIYAGRLPSLRVGRLHYIKATDLELERRRRLGLPLPQHRSESAPARRMSRSNNSSPRILQSAPHADPALRRQRAAERAELVHQWARRHALAEPHAPATVLRVSSPVVCAICQKQVRRGRVIEFIAEPGASAVWLCVSCGRRALLEWADRRRQESTAARHMAQSLGAPQAELQEPLPGPGFQAA